MDHKEINCGPLFLTDNKIKEGRGIDLSPENMLYTEILKDKKVFLRLYKKGRYCTCREVAAYYLPNRLNMNRFGITAGKKLGNAVTRNRAKRIIRSAYRICEDMLPTGYDIVIVAREGIKDKKSTDIEAFIKSRLSKEMLKKVEKGC